MPTRKPARDKKTESKKKPLGPALDWTDGQLDSLATISDADLLGADALWQNEAPKPLKKLLKAEIQEDRQ